MLHILAAFPLYVLKDQLSYIYLATLLLYHLLVLDGKGVAPEKTFYTSWNAYP